jgi:hypothetical protein
MTVCLLVTASLLFAAQNFTQAPARDGSFSISPEQMVFASKLSEPYRKMYCYKFSMIERQEALEEWKEAKKGGDDQGFSPDDAVKMIALESQSTWDEEME